MVRPVFKVNYYDKNGNTEFKLITISYSKKQFLWSETINDNHRIIFGFNRSYYKK